jgi:NAD(P)-dependent dehydrogenase (short-subunit alcohol dehydrogenase family)
MANSQKAAIATGASQGIGVGLVEAFLKRGYSVVANSRTEANPFPTSGAVEFRHLWTSQPSCPIRHHKRPSGLVNLKER